MAGLQNPMTLGPGWVFKWQRRTEWRLGRAFENMSCLVGLPPLRSSWLLSHKSLAVSKRNGKIKIFNVTIPIFKKILATNSPFKKTLCGQKSKHTNLSVGWMWPVRPHFATPDGSHPFISHRWGPGTRRCKVAWLEKNRMYLILSQRMFILPWDRALSMCWHLVLFQNVKDKRIPFHTILSPPW